MSRQAASVEAVLADLKDFSTPDGPLGLRQNVRRRRRRPSGSWWPTRSAWARPTSPRASSPKSSTTSVGRATSATTSSMSAPTWRSPARTSASSPPEAWSRSRGVRRLTMLPLAQLDEGDDTRRGINPAWRSLRARPCSSGEGRARSPERALGVRVPARPLGRGGHVQPSGAAHLLARHTVRRPVTSGCGAVGAGGTGLRSLHRSKSSVGGWPRPTPPAAQPANPPVRALFDELVAGLAYKRSIPWRALPAPRGVDRRGATGHGAGRARLAPAGPGGARRVPAVQGPAPDGARQPGRRDGPAALQLHRSRHRPLHADAAACRPPPLPHVHHIGRTRGRPLQGLPGHLLVPVRGPGPGRPLAAPVQGPAVRPHRQGLTGPSRGPVRGDRRRTCAV